MYQFVLNKINLQYKLKYIPKSTFAEIERKISIRSTREDLIRKGVLKDVDAEATSKNLATVEAQPAENGQNVQVEVTSETNHVGSHGKDQSVCVCVYYMYMCVSVVVVGKDG